MRNYILIVLLSLPFYASSANSTGSNVETFIKLLQSNYQKSNSIKAFALTYNYFGHSNPYQSWDFKAPNRYKAFKVTEIDLEKQHYYQNIVHYYTGGLYLDEVHFQNNKESIRYERNGISLGKSATPQNLNSYNRYTNLTQMNLDFFAVKQLLEETDIFNKIKIEFKTDASQAVVVHEYSKDKIKEYTFNLNPLRLDTIHDKGRKRLYKYSDYRTNNSFQFAHSLVKYYNGDTTPSFITKIERFEVIDQIDKEKLSLPAQYTVVETTKKLTFNVSGIAKDLFLISDNSNKSNTLYKVNENGIMVFGAPSTDKLSTKTIELIEQKHPDKPINGVFVTHPYSDHINGLRPFTEKGIRIYADKYTIEAIRKYPRFSKTIALFKFSPITHEQVIDRVKFYVLESSRSKRQSFAHFEQAGIIYQADFIELARDNTIPIIVPNYSIKFIDFIRNKRLRVNRIVSQNRNNNITLETLNRYYNANSM